MQIRFTLFFLLICVFAQAQNTSSPYSIYGIGDIQTSAYNRTTGMGSTGIAYRSDNSIIQNNPASYSALTQQYFHVELGARGQISTYTNASYSNNVGASQVSNDFTVTRFAVATKINRFWGSSIGILPYSQMNYSFTAETALGPQGEFAATSYEGSGGLHKAYWGNGVELGKHLSLGVTASFLFGALNQQQILVAPTANADLTTTRNLYLRNGNLDFGAQYYTQFGKDKKWGLSLGATYSFRQHLDAEDSLSVLDNGSVIINNALLDRNTLNIPETYGGGIAISKDGRMRKITFLADYQRQNWTPLNYTGTGYALQNSDRYSAGMEIVKRTNIFNTPVEHVYYQLGGFYEKSYLVISGSPVQEWGATAGIGVNPLRYPKWGYNIAFEYGARGNYQAGTIREDFARLTLTIHYWDIWLTKGRKVN